MNNHTICLLVCSMAILLTALSCHQEVKQLELDVVDSLCEVNPKKAMELLEAYENVIHKASKSTRMRYAVLQTKARDKAFIAHTSDSVMREAVGYYADHGSVNERLEAMYYMGSVYRDLHDSPRALQYYLMTADWGEKHLMEVDSMKLRNVYAQLSGLYEVQRDRKRSLNAARREYQLSKDSVYNPITIMDLASSYIDAGISDSAIILYDLSLSLIYEIKQEKRYIDLIAGQLSNLAALKNRQADAKKRLDVIRQHLDLDTIYNVSSSLGEYYMQYGPLDSAVYFNKKALATTSKLKIKKRAAQRIASLYHQMAQKDSTIRYAMLYMEYNDSLVKQQRSDETKNTQHEFEYRQNKEAEEAAYRQAAEAREALLVFGIGGLLVLLVLIFIFWQKERKARREIERKDTEMGNMRDELSRTQEINEDLYSQREMEQKKKETAELSEVLEFMKKKAAGHQVGKTKRELIKEMFLVIDQTYPDFSQNLRNCLPDITKVDLTIAYMNQLGLTNIEIAKLIGLDRSNVHRHLKVIEAAASSN